MKQAFYLALLFLISGTSFSQTNERDLTVEQTLDMVCNNKFFEKCETPVDFKYGKKVLEDSLTNYLKDSSPFQNGKAAFSFIVAKNSKVYDVEKKYGNIVNESAIIKALQQTSDLWTIGKQNSRLICSYVTLEVEYVDNRVKVNMLKRY